MRAFTRPHRHLARANVTPWFQTPPRKQAQVDGAPFYLASDDKPRTEPCWAGGSPFSGARHGQYSTRWPINRRTPARPFQAAYLREPDNVGCGESQPRCFQLPQSPCSVGCESCRRCRYLDIRRQPDTGSTARGGEARPPAHCRSQLSDAQRNLQLRCGAGSEANCRLSG